MSATAMASLSEGVPALQVLTDAGDSGYVVMDDLPARRFMQWRKWCVRIFQDHGHWLTFLWVPLLWRQYSLVTYLLLTVALGTWAVGCVLLGLVKRNLKVLGYIAGCVLLVYGPIWAGMFVYFPLVRIESTLDSKIVPEEHGITHYQWVTFPSIDALYGRSLTIAGMHVPYLADTAVANADCDRSFTGARTRANHLVTVIAVHGTSRSSLDANGKPTFFCAIKPLVCAGFNVLAVDMRNHGRSDTAMPYSLGYHEADDVLAAARWLNTDQNVSYSNIFLFGQSMGATAVAFAASRDPRFSTLALVHAPVSWNFELLPLLGGAAERIGIYFLVPPQVLIRWAAWWFKLLSPDAVMDHSLIYDGRWIQADVLHAHTTGDTLVPIANAEALRQTLEARTGSATYEAYFKPGFAHCGVCPPYTQDIQLGESGPHGYRSKLLQFFSRASQNLL